MTELGGQSDERHGDRRALRFTAGSPFARAVRILLHELELDHDAIEEDAAPPVDEPGASPTLQVPAFRDGALHLWESGLIAEYLLTTYAGRPDRQPTLSRTPWRVEAEWEDRLVFATIQTYGTAATTISQMTWTGVTVANDHLARTSARMDRILEWLDARLSPDGDGFLPGCVSMHDIFLLCHTRFVQARPLGLTPRLDRLDKVSRLLAALDSRDSVRAIPVHWWEP